MGRIPKRSKPKPDESKFSGSRSALTESEMLEALRRSGYLMEGRLAKALQEAGCFVESNLSFPDERSGMSREIDMVAESADWITDTPKTSVKSSFIIESINNFYPVVLMTPGSWSPDTPIDYFLHYKTTSIPDEIPTNAFTLGDKTVSTGFDLLELHRVYGWDTFSQYCSFSRKKQGAELMALHPEDLHSTIRKLAEYLMYTESVLYRWMDDLNDEYWRVFQWRPLLVLRDDLYVYSDNKGAGSLKSIPHARLEYSLHYDGRPSTVIVDFLVEEAAPEFVSGIIAADKQIQRDLHQFRRQYEADRTNGPR